MGQYYEYRHVVGIEETDFVGIVYYVNYVRWQGRCRELFLLEHAPKLLGELQGGLKMITLKSECEFLTQISADDELSIRMRVEHLTQTEIGLAFEYVRIRKGMDDIVAKGSQRVAYVQAATGHTVPVRVPESLRLALDGYAIVRAPRPDLRAVAHHRA
jgi:enediyne biosynthesis thioesterase